MMDDVCFVCNVCSSVVSTIYDIHKKKVAISNPFSRFQFRIRSANYRIRMDMYELGVNQTREHMIFEVGFLPARTHQWLH